MDDNARHARTNDLGSLRYDAMAYLIPVDGFVVFPPSNRDKSKRGFWNVTTSRMLCPLGLIDDFDSRPKE